MGLLPEVPFAELTPIFHSLVGSRGLDFL
jgi:hypothetical protein